MRLRYLHVYNLPPLESLGVKFQHESLLGRKCAIRFVVGVNGSGKSRLLRALTEVFVQLERSTELELPFAVTMAYDVGTGGAAHTVYLRYPGKRSGSWFEVFEGIVPDGVEWDKLDQEQLPRSDIYKDGELPGGGTMPANLPTVLVAYTSGDTQLWRAIFDAPPPDLEAIPEEGADIRPPGWTVQQEREYQESNWLEAVEEDQETEVAPVLRSRIANLVTSEDLKLAALAVTLVQAVDDFKECETDAARATFAEQVRRYRRTEQTQGGLRGLLNEVDWLWPIHIGLQIEVDMKSNLVRRQRDRLRRLYRIATGAIKQPEPSQVRLLSFDLQSIARRNDAETEPEKSTAQALAEALTDRSDGFTPFEIYRTLYELRQQGVLKGVEIALQKSNLDDVLLYEWLSDGEKEFLGRMALFNLLHDQDDALVILDEPETHFNDVWKRRIVDIIDDSLRDNASEVVISTHSSIALTDVFETEITLLRKDSEDGTVAVVRQPAINTFGASPNEIMRHIFGAPDTVGQRAAEYLDLILVAISQPDAVQAVWAMTGDDETIRESQPFLRMFEQLGNLPHQYGDPEQAKGRLLNALRAVRGYASRKLAREVVSVADVVAVLRNRLGPGYYEFEFSRRLRALERGASDAS